MVPEIAELVRLDFVFLGFVVVHIAFAAAVTPGAFHHPLFADEIGGLHGVGFVGGPENHPVPQVQGQNFGFVVAQRRDQRGGALRGGDNGSASLADDVHAVVIAGAVFAGRHESLRFVRPQDEQVVLGASGLGFVEPAQGVIVKEQFQERVHIAPFGLKFLGHRGEDDFALVNGRKRERAFAGAKNFGHFRGQEILQIVANGFADPAKLLGRLGEETVEKVGVNGDSARGFEEVFEVLHFVFEQLVIGQ